MRLLLASLFLAAAASPAFADDETTETEEETSPPVMRGTEKGTVGVGLMLGEPTGICAKLYLADDKAIQAGAGFAFFGSGFQLHADYVIHPYIVAMKPEYVMALYVGAGVRAIEYSRHDDQYLGLGLRAVGGLLIDFQFPLDAFAEVAGITEYRFDSGSEDDKGFGIGLNATVGARYYF